MAYRVVPDRQGLISIGKLKENLVTEVELPAPGFEGGSYAVLLQRPREKQPYPVTARTEGNALIWTVQTADTAIPGTGKLECRWYGDNGEVAKSQIYMVRITDGLPDPTEAPEAWEGFMGQVARNAQAAQIAASEAKASADGAAASAGIAQGAAAEAGKLARAAGEAANAAASAASAASSAKAGAETAGQNARAAAEAAETARSGAEAAKLAAADSVTAAAESAETAAQAAQKGENLYNQVKADLVAGKLKGEKGEKGDPGKDAPQIDDGTISRDNPWSSRHIIETLCPPIAESGNPVTCYPVAGGYPLGVVARWEPTQAGTGDPSPENIRPIKGRDSVTVERCGVNLAIVSELKNRNVNHYFENIQIARNIKPDTYYTVSYDAISDVSGWKSNIGFGNVYSKDALWISVNGKANAITHVSGTIKISKDDMAKVGNNLWIRAVRYDTITTYTYSFSNMMVTVGTTEPTTYAPYRGDTLDLQLHRTVYDGKVDAVMGEGQETWKLRTLDGNSEINTYREFEDTDTYKGFVVIDAVKGIDISRDAICSHFKRGMATSEGYHPNEFVAHHPAGHLYLRTEIPGVTSVETFKAYLAAQAAAGTPVQIAYKLAESVPFQATGNGPIMPIPGETNTVMTDADSITITGRADPAHAIAALQAQLATATQQLVETQAAMLDTTAMAVDYIYQQDLEDIGLEEVDDSDNQTDTELVDVPGV